MPSSPYYDQRRGVYFAKSNTPYYDYETYEKMAKPPTDEEDDLPF